MTAFYVLYIGGLIFRAFNFRGLGRPRNPRKFDAAKHLLNYSSISINWNILVRLNTYCYLDFIVIRNKRFQIKFYHNLICLFVFDMTVEYFLCVNKTLTKF